MRRVNVIGSGSGVGKTTFGRRLAERLGVPFIELDALFWGPTWADAPADVFRERVAAALSGDGWVADGNYSGRLGTFVWSLADTVIWLDVPLRVALWRTIARAVRRIRTREELWAGNRETFRNTFLSRRSLILYVIRHHRGRRRKFEQRLASPEAAHLMVHRFTSNAEADRWLASL